MLGYRAIDPSSGRKNALLNKLLNMSAIQSLYSSIPFLHGNKKLMIHPSRIIRLEARSNYTCIYFTDHAPVLMARVLKLYEKTLKPYGFIRTHRTHLINPQFIKGLNLAGQVQMEDQSLAEISRRKRKEVIPFITEPILMS